MLKSSDKINWDAIMIEGDRNTKQIMEIEGIYLCNP